MRANNCWYELRGVNPDRWLGVMRDVAGELNLPHNLVCDMLGILGRIYRVVPPWLEGAQLLLGTLAWENIPFIIVTHANRAWTDWKYEVTGLGAYISRERIIVLDENGQKGVEEWKSAFK